MHILQKITLAITIIGAINWGLVGLFDFNLVTFALGSYPIAVKAVYIFICATALFSISLLFMRRRKRAY